MENNNDPRTKNMTAGELIEALQRFDPNAEVVINVKQYNKVFGVVQLPVVMSTVDTELHRKYTWVDASYRGATITVHLPYGAFVSKLPK